MNLSKITKALRSEPTESSDRLIGTVEVPIYLSAANHPRALTGQRAQQSVQSRLKADDVEKDLDAFFPIGGRAQRRATARQEARQQRRGQRAYTNRQLLKERVVGDLVQQFNIVDGHVPARQSTIDRVRGTLYRKAELLVEQAEAEGQELTVDEAWVRLRDVASGKTQL